MNSFKGIANRIKRPLASIGHRVAGVFTTPVSLGGQTGAAAEVSGQKQIDLDKKLVYNLSKSRIPNWRQLRQLKRFLTPRERWTIRIGFLLIIGCVVFVSTRFYYRNLQAVPVAGGEYSEGLIGTPKYINPLYAILSDVDNDLSRLIYSSLFRRDQNGELIPDLVDSYEVSEDGKTYTLTLRDNIQWHNGSPLTVDDVLFTFSAINDTSYKSPLKNSFSGVEIERIDDRKLKFVLTDPYAAFLELLTFGILPADLWAQIPPEATPLAQLNLKPIGSGPYKFNTLSKDKNGNIRDYTLTANQDYYQAPPKIDLHFIFYGDFQEAVTALNDNAIDGLSYLPYDLKDQILTPRTYNFHKLYLPQLTLIFFNQAQNPALGDKAVRQALAFAIDRNRIINDILGGDAYIVDSPILANSFAYNPNVTKYDYNVSKAAELLDSVDWKLSEVTDEDIAQAQIDAESDDEEVRNKANQILFMGAGQWRMKDGNYLVISLKTVERNENQLVIDAVKHDWEAVGVKTATEALPLSRIQSEVIKTRQFDALFYGQVVGGDPDPYAFWHSSQTGENGFNIANFADKDVDQLLEDARLTSDQGARQEKYLRFQEIITDDEPVIFMYSPIYTYVQSNKVKGFAVTNILYPRNRFANVTDWYIRTGKRLVWPGDNQTD